MAAAAPAKTTASPKGTCKKPCECKSDFQDEKHGRGVRVHNNGAKGASCTVCGKQKGFSPS